MTDDAPPSDTEPAHPRARPNALTRPETARRAGPDASARDLRHGHRRRLGRLGRVVLEKCPPGSAEARLLDERTGSTPRQGSVLHRPPVDEPHMAFVLKRWRWKLSPAARRARTKHAQLVAGLPSAKRAT
jgi:hypothetical protein